MFWEMILNDEKKGHRRPKLPLYTPEASLGHYEYAMLE
jgi:hypothetical protein